MRPQAEITIGRYVVCAELGRGAMGVVSLARDPVVGRFVAVKTILLPDGFSQEQRETYRQRFLREARAAGSLSHPNIVTVHDCHPGGNGETPYIVMEHVEGRSLRRILRTEGCLDPERSFGIAISIAHALHAAHVAGVIHRDVKPANILVRDGDGVVKLTDFGVARISVAELTQCSTTIGSPTYMAPETIRGGQADARSDLFSLAVVLYEMLCGERPFWGEDPAAVCYALLHETPKPITAIESSYCPALDEFFDRALAKDPDRRFPDAMAFSHALARARKAQELFDEGTVGADRRLATMVIHRPDPPPAEPAPAEDAARHSADEEVVSVATSPPPAEDRPAAAPDPAEPSGSALTRGLAAAVMVVVLVALVLALGTTGGGGEDALESPDGLATNGVDAAAPRPAAAPVDGAPSTAATTLTTDGQEEAGGGGAARAAASAPASAARETTASSADRDASPARSDAGGSPAGGTAATEPPAPAPRSTRVAPAAASAKPEATAGPAATTTAPATDLAASGAPPAARSAEAQPPPGATAVAGTGVLALDVRNAFKEGVLTLLVDDREVWSQDLSSESNQMARAYKRVLGRVQEDLEHRVELAAGFHRLEVRVDVAGRDEPLRRFGEVELKPGESRTLEIVAGRLLGSRLVVKLAD